MFAEDLTSFFNTTEFADEATLAGVDVDGFFDKNHVISSGGMGFASTRPAFTLPTAVAGATPVGKALVHGGITYKVAAVDPEGTDRDITVLLLETA
jgi:hypothetical protein